MITIEPEYINGISDPQLSRVVEVIRKLNEFLGCASSKRKIRKFITSTEFTQTDESSDVLFDRFISGAERGSVADEVWQAKIRFYYKRFSSAKGYTYVGNEEININRKYYPLNFYDYTDEEREMVETLLHEYCHLVGMDHAYDYTPERNDSAPYKIGRVLSEMYVEFHQIVKEPKPYHKPWYKKILFWL